MKAAGVNLLTVIRPAVVLGVLTTGITFALAHSVIPHTQALTTLDDLAPGRRFNLEIDILARYLGRMEQLRR